MHKKLWNKDFTLMLQGDAFSTLGDLLYSVAIGYWVYEQTGSSTLMGVMSSISMSSSSFAGAGSALGCAATAGAALTGLTRTAARTLAFLSPNLCCAISRVAFSTVKPTLKFSTNQLLITGKEESLLTISSNSAFV